MGVGYVFPATPQEACDARITYRSAYLCFGYLSVTS